MIRRLAALLAILACTVPVSAQSVPSYGETVEVRIGNVDVVVTDRNGNHIEGLTRDDFEILENGTAQPLTNFYEIRRPTDVQSTIVTGTGFSGSVPSEGDELRRRRNFVFFIDTYSLAPHRRNEALTAMRRFAKQNLRQGDQAMLVVFNRSLHVLHPFSTDVNVVSGDMEGLFRQTGGTLESDQRTARLRVVTAFQEAILAAQFGLESIRNGYASALGVARDFALEQHKIAEGLSESLEETFRAIAGVEGRKVMIFVGESFPTYPGIAMYQFVNDTFERYATQVQLSVPQVLAARDTLASVTERVTRAANANEVTVHSIYSGDDSIDSASDLSRQSTPQSRYLDFSDNGGTLAGLSRDTGGIALVGARSFEKSADAIAHDLDSYYSLGYRLNPDMRGERLIVVRMRDRTLKTRTRRALTGKTLDDEIADHAVSRMVQDSPTEPDRLQVTTGAPARDRARKIRVPVGISFPTSLLTLLEQDGRKAGGFDIVVTASDDGHRLSEVSRRHQEVSWLAAGVPPLINYNVDVLLRDRSGKISVAVIDRWTRTPYYGIVAVKP